MRSRKWLRKGESHLICKHISNLGFWRNVREIEKRLPDLISIPVIKGVWQAGAFNAEFSDFDLNHYTCKCKGTASLRQSSSVSILAKYWFNVSINSVNIQYKQNSGASQGYLTIHGGFPQTLTIDKSSGTISFNLTIDLPYGYTLPSGYSFTGDGSIVFDITWGE